MTCLPVSEPYLMGCGIREKDKPTKAFGPTKSLSHMTASLLSPATCWDPGVGVLR